MTQSKGSHVEGTHNGKRCASTSLSPQEQVKGQRWPKGLPFLLVHHLSVSKRRRSGWHFLLIHNELYSWSRAKPWAPRPQHAHEPGYPGKTPLLPPGTLLDTLRRRGLFRAHLGLSPHPISSSGCFKTTRDQATPPLNTLGFPLSIPETCSQQDACSSSWPCPPLHLPMQPFSPVPQQSLTDYPNMLCSWLKLPTLCSL